MKSTMSKKSLFGHKFLTTDITFVFQDSLVGFHMIFKGGLLFVASFANLAFKRKHAMNFQTVTLERTESAKGCITIVNTVTLVGNFLIPKFFVEF